VVRRDRWMGGGGLHASEAARAADDRGRWMELFYVPPRQTFCVEDGTRRIRTAAGVYVCVCV